MADTINWTKSDGSVVVAAASSLTNGITYYSEIPVGLASNFAVSITNDANVIVTVTIEACNNDTATAYAAVGSSGWFTQPTLGSIVVAGGSAGSDAFVVTGAHCSRYRLKGVVGGTGGVATPRVQVKGT